MDPVRRLRYEEYLRLQRTDLKNFFDSVLGPQPVPLMDPVIAHVVSAMPHSRTEGSALAAAGLVTVECQPDMSTTPKKTSNIPMWPCPKRLPNMLMKLNLDPFIQLIMSIPSLRTPIIGGQPPPEAADASVYDLFLSLYLGKSLETESVTSAAASLKKLQVDASAVPKLPKGSTRAIATVLNGCATYASAACQAPCGR